MLRMLSHKKCYLDSITFLIVHNFYTAETVNQLKRLKSHLKQRLYPISSEETGLKYEDFSVYLLQQLFWFRKLRIMGNIYCRDVFQSGDWDFTVRAAQWTT